MITSVMTESLLLSLWYDLYFNLSLRFAEVIYREMKHGVFSFPANGREGHMILLFLRLPFVGRRFNARRTYFPFEGNAKTRLFAAHLYRPFQSSFRPLIFIGVPLLYHPSSRSTCTICKAKRVLNSTEKDDNFSVYIFCLVTGNGD